MLNHLLGLNSEYAAKGHWIKIRKHVTFTAAFTHFIEKLSGHFANHPLMIDLVRAKKVTIEQPKNQEEPKMQGSKNHLDWCMSST